jgi:hypothetical protein
VWAAWAGVGALIVAIAFALRIAVHAGRQPGGVDTWYYLAYADAFRTRPSLKVRLPQYLLQDEVQSYPPLFPMFLALFPQRWLKRWYWTISPAIDCVHLLLLYWLAFKITESVAVSAVTAGIYATTPHLVSETRSLMPRSFGALLHSIAMVLTMRHVVFEGGTLSLGAAVLATTALFLASATPAIAHVVATAVLTLLFDDTRYVAIAAAGFVGAIVVSGGHYVRVIRNYAFALQFWYRNRRFFGAHPVRDSPVLGSGVSGPELRRPWFLGRDTLPQVLRLVGENPFILALPFTPAGVPPWGVRLYCWAVSVVALALVATVIPPLRAFGAGRSFMRAAVFPVAYSLAVGVGTLSGFRRPLGIATLACLALSLASIAVFWRHSRRTAMATSFVPEGLRQAVSRLAALPGDGVLVLPDVYADYACYHSGKRVLWGGHSGDLTKWQEVKPVISRPVPALLRDYGAQYVLLDTTFADIAQLGMADRVITVGYWNGFALYDATPARADSVSAAARPLE